MTDFFKSALGIFGDNRGAGGGAAAGMAGPAAFNANKNSSQNTGPSSVSNDFVGQQIMISSYKLRVVKVLAEGKLSYSCFVMNLLLSGSYFG